MTLALGVEQLDARAVVGDEQPDECPAVFRRQIVLLIVPFDRAVGVEHVDEDLDLLADGDASKIGADARAGRAVAMAFRAVLLEDQFAFGGVAVTLGLRQQLIHDFPAVRGGEPAAAGENLLGPLGKRLRSACWASFCC